MATAAKSLLPLLVLLLLLFVIAIVNVVVVAAFPEAVDGNTTLPEKAGKRGKPGKPHKHNDEGQEVYQWCLARFGLPDSQYQALISFCCRQPGVDCQAIQDGGLCWYPSDLKSHADYALNYYFYVFGRCIGAGLTTIVNPSHESCHFPATKIGGRRSHHG